MVQIYSGKDSDRCLLKLRIVGRYEEELTIADLERIDTEVESAHLGDQSLKRMYVDTTSTDNTVVVEYVSYISVTDRTLFEMEQNLRERSVIDLPKIIVTTTKEDDMGVRHGIN